MAISYLSSGDISTTYNGSSVTLDLPASATYEDGDLLVGAVFAYDCTTISWPVGWTEIDFIDHGAGNGMLSVAYAWATGSYDETPTVSYGAGVSAVGGIAAFRGVGSVAIGNGAAGLSSSTNESIPGIASTGAGSFAVLVWANERPQEHSVTPIEPAGWDVRFAYMQTSTPYYRRHNLSLLSQYIGSATADDVDEDASSTYTWSLLMFELLEEGPGGGGGSESESSATLGSISGSASGTSGSWSSRALGVIAGGASGSFSSTTWIADEGASIGASSSAVADLLKMAAADSSVSVSSSASSPVFLVVLADSSVLAVHAASAYRLLDVAVDSNSALSTSAPVAAVYSVSAASLVSVLTGLQFVADFTDGWAYNLNTGAGSFYEGFRFNSFAMIDGEYYGANEAGIFRLGGDADDSAPIDMTITLGTSNLGSSRVKRVPTAYVGAQSDEPLVLTCRVEGQEYSYTFSRATATMAPAKVQIGKGLAGVYWQIELSNTAGADAEIDVLELLVAPSDRRRV